MNEDRKTEEFVAQFKKKHKCITCGAIGIPDPIIGCTRCGFDDMVPLEDAPDDDPRAEGAPS